MNRWAILAVLFTARISVAVGFQAVAAVLPFLVADLGLTYTQAGALIGLFMLPGILLAIPAGWLGARLGDRPVALAGLAAMVVGSALIAQATAFHEAALGRLVCGAGAIVLNVLLAKMTTDWFCQPRDRDRDGLPDQQLAARPGARDGGLRLVGDDRRLAGGALRHGRRQRARFRADRHDLPPAAGGRDACRRRPVPDRVARPRARGARRRRLGHLQRERGDLRQLRPDLPDRAGLVGGVRQPRREPHRLAVRAADSARRPHRGPHRARRATDRRLDARDRAPDGSEPVAPAPLVLLVLVGVVWAAPAGPIMALPQILPSEERAAGFGVFFTVFYLGMATLPPAAGWLLDLARDPAAPLLFAAAIMASATPVVWLFRLRAVGRARQIVPSV